MHLFKASLHINNDAVPRFHRPRPVPFALRETVGQELDRMEKEGVLECMRHSQWAAPIVLLSKKDVTANSALQVDQYPLPNPEDLFATFMGGQKLDLKQVYWQMPLGENDKELVIMKHIKVFISSPDYHLELLRHWPFSSKQWTPFFKVSTCDYRAYRGGTPQQTRRGVPESASPWPEVEGSKMCLPARFWGTPSITHTTAEKMEVINSAPTPKN